MASRPAPWSSGRICCMAFIDMRPDGFQEIRPMRALLIGHGATWVLPQAGEEGESATPDAEAAVGPRGFLRANGDARELTSALTPGCCIR